MALRSTSPELVQQEIWGDLCCHYAIRTLMADVAGHNGHNLDRLSFVAALRISRQSVAGRRSSSATEDHRRSIRSTPGFPVT